MSKLSLLPYLVKIKILNYLDDDRSVIITAHLMTECDLYLPMKNEGAHIVIYNPSLIRVVNSKQIN